MLGLFYFANQIFNPPICTCLARGKTIPKASGFEAATQ